VQLSNQGSYNKEGKGRRRKANNYIEEGRPINKGKKGKKKNNIRTRVLNNLDVLGQGLFVLARTFGAHRGAGKIFPCHYKTSIRMSDLMV